MTKRQLEFVIVGFLALLYTRRLDAEADAQFEKARQLQDKANAILLGGEPA